MPSRWFQVMETFPYLSTVAVEVFARAPVLPLGKTCDSPCTPLFQCTASCGGGFQKRTVHCVSSEDNTTEDRCLCDHEPRPPEFRKCSQQACKKSDGGWMTLPGGERAFINKVSCVNRLWIVLAPFLVPGIFMLKRPASCTQASCQFGEVWL